jgi:nitrite reductase/ring-hydroxylating ferredoxin subunit
MSSKNFLKFLIFTVISISLFTTCKKDKLNDMLNIPYVQVDQYLFLNDPQYIQLSVVGGWSYLPGGSRGIVIYRRAEDEFVAYDRHCTYETSNPCGRVEIDSSTFVSVKCACCPSQFMLFDGSILTGPAPFGLLPYRTQFSSGNTLRVFN